MSEVNMPIYIHDLDMNQIFFLVLASLMLIGATTVVAIPITVEAASSQWCGDGGCFQGKGNCVRASSDGVCIKQKPF